MGAEVGREGSGLNYTDVKNIIKGKKKWIGDSWDFLNRSQKFPGNISKIKDVPWNELGMDFAFVMFRISKTWIWKIYNYKYKRNHIWPSRKGAFESFIIKSVCHRKGRNINGKNWGNEAQFWTILSKKR